MAGKVDQFVDPPAAFFIQRLIRAWVFLKKPVHHSGRAKRRETLTTNVRTVDPFGIGCDFLS